MTTSTDDVVLFECVDDHIAVVTLNRPEKCNAVNVEVTTRLYDIVNRIEADKDLWVAVLTSSTDRVFCAGADLAAVSAGKGMEIVHPEAGFAGFVNAARKKPWIAAVAGKALGGGMEICLACDMVVCGKNALFGLPEVKRSMVAGAGGSYRLPRVIPRAIALEMLSTGEPIDAGRAFDLGLVNRVVDRGQEKDQALKLAGTICGNAPIAVRETLAIARLANERSETELQELSNNSYGILSKTKDFKEGPLAFIEKRAPRWTGE
jgi:enoyl-CoA hydratase/carnithine racemase